MTLTCKKCGREKAASTFSKHPMCTSGYDTSRCKACKKAAWDWSRVPIERRMLHRSKARAKAKGREFDLVESDIVLPDKCPVFGVPFEYGHYDWTYSLDRVNPSKGYTKENVVVISNKANRIKNDASVEELEMVLDWMRGACEIV